MQTIQNFAPLKKLFAPLKNSCRRPCLYLAVLLSCLCHCVLKLRLGPISYKLLILHGLLSALRTDLFDIDLIYCFILVRHRLTPCALDTGSIKVIIKINYNLLEPLQITRCVPWPNDLSTVCMKTLHADCQVRQCHLPNHSTSLQLLLSRISAP